MLEGARQKRVELLRPLHGGLAGLEGEMEAPGLT